MIRSAIILALAVLCASSSVRADVLDDVGTGLAFSGFDVRGGRNPLSGGADLLITRQFNGSLFDFGATELTLQGPISLEVSTGGRLLPQFDVSFSTAVSGRSQPAPLNYSYVSDIGPQSTSISGSMLIDGDFSINALGFYDLTLTSSTRRTVERDGVVTDVNTFDSDIGPITLSGNIFADALAMLTDPLFEQTGRENPFSVLSKLLIDPNSAGPIELTSLPELTPDAFMEANRSFDALHPASPRAHPRGSATHMVVPEPTVLVLLLLGLPVLIHRSWRRG